MNLKEIISITGRPGLFKVVAQGKQSVIVESLVDKKRIPAHASDRISSVGDISIYGTDEDINLTEILERFFDRFEGKACPSHKEELSKLEAILGEIFPKYDRERVYKSDLRKIFQWYNILINAGIPIKEEKKEDSDKQEDTPKPEVKTSVKKISKVKGPGQTKMAKPSSAKTSAHTKTGSQRGN